MLLVTSSPRADTNTRAPSSICPLCYRTALCSMTPSSLIDWYYYYCYYYYFYYYYKY